MKWYIYVITQQGNIGPHQTILLKDHQPAEGFDTEQQGEEHLVKLIEARKGYYFERDWYHFVILKTWQSKSALDKKD